jgi:hypothetical protein
MIQSRPKQDKPLSDYLKFRGDQKYEPIPLNEASVFMFSQHWFTLDEIATAFQVDPQLITRHYASAYEMGKQDALMKPRMLKRDCAVLLQGYIDGYKQLVDDGAAIQPAEAAEIRKIYEAMLRAEGVTSVNRAAIALEHNLAKLTDDELKQKLADAGFIKKE